MKSSFNNGVLRLFLEGEINSYNADNIAKEIDAVIAQQAFKKLVLDFSHVNYISSAGLRIVLKLKQKYQEVSVAETSLEVFDIFSMTGFTNIMTIRKALRTVYLSGAVIIGSGYYSTVYRLDNDTIVKVYNHVSDEDQVERELMLSKEAFMLGIPTAISYDIVKVDDKLGVCFEMLDCESLGSVVTKNPDKIGEYVVKYAELLKTINSLSSDNPIIPSIKEEYFSKLDEIKGDLDDKVYEKAHKLLENIPERDTLVHGDCHFKNILVQNDKLLIVDLETLSKGHPIFELASLYSSYVGFSEYNPKEAMEFFGVSADKTEALYNKLIELYFGKDDRVIKEKISIVGYINICRWYKVHSKDQETIKKYLKRLTTLLDKYNDLDIGI